ncbi:hypothetical protein AGLY_013005 [Aphis glycines]|uniref:Uncharacterized protein n=1 Tax=Aphis glycines TaxID=307491 RepID=A0A6G0T7G9_APHGL|nr:hypothetical protein AGLY_013005 [Aphis glycines]
MLFVYELGVDILYFLTLSDGVLNNSLKMPHKYIVVGILALVLIFTDYLCGSVGSVEIAISHKLCKCFNTTNDYNDNGSIKCMCVQNELKKIPNDLPTPLHELIIGKASIASLTKDSFTNYKKSIRDIKVICTCNNGLLQCYVVLTKNRYRTTSNVNVIALAQIFVKTLRDLRNLVHIENGIFDNMKQLRTIHEDFKTIETTHADDYLVNINSRNKQQLLNSERSDECIDFTMMCVFFFCVSVYSITSRNNAPISNYGGGFRCKN